MSTPTALSIPLPDFALICGAPALFVAVSFFGPPFATTRAKTGIGALFAKLQLKAVGQQALQTKPHWLMKYQDLIGRHAVRVATQGFLRIRRQIESLGSDPSRAARELIVAYVVSDLNQKTQRGIGNEQFSASRKIDFQVTIRSARLDRRHFERRQRGCCDRLRHWLCALLRPH